MPKASCQQLYFSSQLCYSLRVQSQHPLTQWNLGDGKIDLTDSLNGKKQKKTYKLKSLVIGTIKLADITIKQCLPYMFSAAEGAEHWLQPAEEPLQSDHRQPWRPPQLEGQYIKTYTQSHEMDIFEGQTKISAVVQF